MKFAIAAIAAITLSATIFTYALPSADEVLNTYYPQKEDTSKAQLIQQFEDRIEKKATHSEKATEWLESYVLWTKSKAGQNRWDQRDSLKKELEAFGQHFPHKSTWAQLTKDIQALRNKNDHPSLVSLQLILELLNANETNAIQLLEDQFATSSSTNTGIVNALFKMNRPNYADIQFKNQLLQIANAQSDLLQLQKAAFEIWLQQQAQNERLRLNTIPDLSQLYSGTELNDAISKLTTATGSKIRAHQLNDTLIPLIYAEIKRQGITPDESFYKRLNPSSDTYTDDVAYFKTKHTDYENGSDALILQVTESIRNEDVDKAWDAWEQLIEQSPEEAQNVLSELFGYRSGSYPRFAITKFSHRLLPHASNAESLNQLSRAIPLQSVEDDVVIQQINKLLDEEKDTNKRIELQTVTLNRLLNFGHVDAAETIAQKILEQPQEAFQTIKSKQQLQTILSYASAFDLLEKQDTADKWVDLLSSNMDTVEKREASRLQVNLSKYYYNKEDREQAFTEAVKALSYSNHKNLASGRENISNVLDTLLTLYVEAGQYEDAVALLDNANGWGSPDIKSVRSYSNIGSNSLHTNAAIALHAVGKTKQSIAILKDCLRYMNTGDDSAYEAFIEIDPDHAMDFFKELESENPFEERPLIWQAVQLNQAGHHEEAEKTARAAIAIDPSDGEQNTYNRMRAYAILSNILEARNDEEAELLKNVVEAVDVSEVGDKYRRAGLQLHALDYYRDAMLLFSDAYCVRFRAAVELEAAGFEDEAEMHFRKAYELMPHQFGRIESHCFGCEGAFQGKRAERIAGDVFNKMLKTLPEQASLYYLMGYLEKSKSKPDLKKALEHFEKAVTLDPLYYNAWSNISDLTRNDTSNSELHFSARKAMLQVDPKRSIRQLDRLPMAQLGSLWETLEEILPILPERDTSVYPLTVSAKNLDQNQYRRYDQNLAATIKHPGAFILNSNQVSNFILESIFQ